ncbi:hypothetical protein TWF281_011355 [Arthrobotrys megalospora]
MGLYISRVMIAMESQAPKPDNVVPDEGEIFHPSKRLRGFLGVGLVLQGCIGVTSLVFFIFGAGYYNSNFSFEIFRLLGLVYTVAFLWNSTIWFLCIYYNKSLPRNKLFIFTELARSVPWMLAAIVFIVVAIPEVIRELSWNFGGGYYRGPPLIQFIIGCTVVLLAGGLALWSLVRMFVYFIKERKAEIVKALKIAQKKYEEDQPAENNGGDNGPRDRVVNGNDSEEETALLIDHDQMV